MRLFLLSLFIPAILASTHPTVYLIRHGEKPKTGENLDAQGEQRAQCLRYVFGAKSSYNIGYIMAEKPKSDSHLRPNETVYPLSQDLAGVIYGGKTDTHCGESDATCVVKRVKAYQGKGNILIAWEHKHLENIVKAFNVSNPIAYNGSRFDLIWTLPYPYNKLTDVTASEGCCFTVPGAKNDPNAKCCAASP